MNEHAQRTKLAKRTILEVLANATPHALQEESLRLTITDRFAPPLAEAEFEEAIVFLSARDYIRSTPDAMEEKLNRWLITQLGQDFLLSL